MSAVGNNFTSLIYNTRKARKTNKQMYTCILVLMTSRGVFPKTLAAPATAPNPPVTRGFMALFGSSPGERMLQSHKSPYNKVAL